MGAVLALSMSFTAHADEIQVPFPVYMEKFRAECLKSGLDLQGNDDSKGFVKDEGGKFSVFTYKPCTAEQREIVKQATWKTYRK